MPSDRSRHVTANKQEANSQHKELSAELGTDRKYQPAKDANAPFYTDKIVQDNLNPLTCEAFPPELTRV